MINHKIMFFLLCIHFALISFGEDAKIKYKCEGLQLGQQLPIRLLKIRKDKIEKCRSLCSKEQSVRYDEPTKISEIKDDWIEEEKAYNMQLLNELSAQEAVKSLNPSVKAKVHPLKRFVYLDKDKIPYILETRYITYTHSGMGFELNCYQKQASSNLKDNCVGMTEQAERAFDRESFLDKRLNFDSVKIQFLFGKQEPNRLIARISKKYRQERTEVGLKEPVSSTGEAVILSDLKRFSIDAGVDEQLLIYKGADGQSPFYHRLPAVELKLICERK